MRLENRLTVPVPVEEAWRVLLDIERVTPCVPGATLVSRDGDTCHGRIRVRLGPVGLTYSGTVTFLSRNEAERTVVLEAGGRENRGNGTARALVTCRLAEAGERSAEVFVETDLVITGKPAQFGRGTLAEVANTLIARFAENLARELAADPPHAVAPTVPVPPDPPPAAVVAGARRAAEPLDLVDAAGAGVLKRLGPAAVLTVLLALVLGLRSRRRHCQVTGTSRRHHPTRPQESR
ncbi:SRPBCC family protein [Streptomyces griseoruber]|uniref:SRPBCC family protein n=1 Tax=Streptomyces griseoruber TaxID=1943 RepID=UPI0007C7CB47|nr:SRPBCC family protein [Streptomyces griseoruber]